MLSFLLMHFHPLLNLFQMVIRFIMILIKVHFPNRYIADLDSDGKLCLFEFTIAMHLVKNCAQGIIFGQ